MAFGLNDAAPGVANAMASVARAIASIQNMKFQRLLMLAQQQREDRLRQEDREYAAGLRKEDREYDTTVRKEGWEREDTLYKTRREDLLSDYELEKQSDEEAMQMQYGLYNGQDPEKLSISRFNKERLDKADRMTEEEWALKKAELALRSNESSARLKQIELEIEIAKQQWADSKENKERQRELEEKLNSLITEYDSTMANLDEQPDYSEVPLIYRAIAGSPSGNGLTAPAEKWLSGTGIGRFLYGSPLSGDARNGYSMDVTDKVGKALSMWKDMEPDKYTSAQQKANEKRAYEETQRLRRAMMALGIYDRDQYMNDPMGSAINYNPEMLGKLPVRNWGR